MKVAFTICSNNYLPRARVVADTFIKHHPDYEFYFYLVDKRDAELDYRPYEKYHFIEIASVFSEIDTLAIKYNIIELSTAIKPFLFLEHFKNGADTILYLDPDLQIYGRFSEIEDALINNNGVLTPHFCSPIDDGKYPSEINFTQFGLYNLGFLALKKSDESIRFLNWWHDRLMKYCFIRPDESMFTDQLWVNYGPVFFEGFHILKHLGYNAANWNLYERNFSKENGHFKINGEFDLKFFHFSNYPFSNPYKIAKFQTRHTIEELPVVKEIIDGYQQKLIDNDFALFNDKPSYYQQIYISHKSPDPNTNNTLKKRVRNRIVRYIDVFLG